MFENVTRGRVARRGFLKGPAVIAAMAAHAVCAYGLTTLPNTDSGDEETVEMATYLILRAPDLPTPPSPARSDAPRRDRGPVAVRSARAPAREAVAAPARDAEPAVERVAELALATLPRTLDVIPPSGLALDSALLRGLGEVSGGAAMASAGGATALLEDDGGGAPVVESEVFTSPPRLLNRFLIRRLMSSDYPPRLQFRGIEGQVVVAFIIGVDGRPEMNHVQVVSATHEAFISAALRGLRHMRFRPAQFDGRPVRVRVSLPMVWQMSTG